MLRSTHDDWERLVAAVLKKQQLWELFHAHSRSPSVLSDASSSSDLGSSSFREIDTSSAYWQQIEDAVSRLENRVPKLVLVSDFVPAFDLEDVNLSSLELLGTGTFGSYTYVGDVSDGVKIVVKRIKSLGVSEDEYKRFMDVVGRVQHENVIALRAYYCSEDEKLMLYDYHGKGSVHQLLHGKINESPAHVTWETRLRIAIGAARGLASIHSQNGGKLVHGNVKSSNIFLNEGNYGSISDLGLTNLIRATFMPKARCYAPEVKNTQDLSQESDVYSFGILLFELLTRKSPVHVPGGPEAVDLVKLMKSVKSKQMTPKVFDASLLQYPAIREQMVKVLQIGISCVVKSARKRPKMSEVAKMLDDLDISIPSVLNRPNLLVFVCQNDVPKTEDPFDLEDLLGASAEVIGKGTFGTSYKASLQSGIIVRVKRLKDVNVTSTEFKHHMDILGGRKNKNFAQVMAYYFSKDEVLLVGEYFDGDSLSALLHENSVTRNYETLLWDNRLRIALSTAKGIAHIHKLDGSKLFHGNIRSSNIILDGEQNTVITDAAMSKLTKPIRYTALKLQGYIAPEVKDTRNMSQPSDVYSFGVILLELLTRRQPLEMTSDGEALSFVNWIENCVINDLTSEIFDAELLRYNDEEAMLKVLQLALDCVVIVPEQRPRMPEVVKKLEEISGIYHEEEFELSSIESSSEDFQSWIGSRLEDALEDQMSRLMIQS